MMTDKDRDKESCGHHGNATCRHRATCCFHRGNACCLHRDNATCHHCSKACSFDNAPAATTQTTGPACTMELSTPAGGELGLGALLRPLPPTSARGSSEGINSNECLGWGSKGVILIEDVIVLYRQR